MSGEKRGNGAGSERVTFGDTRPRVEPTLGTAGTPAAGTGAGGEKQTAPAGDQPRLPLLYKSVVPLQKGLHGDLGLVAGATYGFAAGVNVVPLNAVEFAVASRTYPIVFAGDDTPAPVAVLGLQPGQNLFVDDAGRWDDGAYVPAYVRRYPFIFAGARESDQYALSLDTSSSLVESGGARPLFEGDEPSDLTKKALEFCRSYHQHHGATAAFAKAIGAQGLLADRAIELKLPSDRKIALRGFRAIDDKKLDALADDDFLDWRRRNWLPLIYSHLGSLANWGPLVSRAVRQGREPTAS